MYKLLVRILEDQYGLLYQNGDFVRVLKPGLYRLWRNLRPYGTRDSVEVYDRQDARFENDRLRSLVEKPALAELLDVVDLKDDERALVWIDGRLDSILGPGLHAFWREPRKIRIERHTVGAGRFVHDQMDTVLKVAGSASHLTTFMVDAYQVALVFVDGNLIESVGPGRYVHWLGRGTLNIRTIDLREQVLDVSGQEIMTQDKVGLRMNLVVQFVVANPEIAVTATTDYSQALYREAQLALRAAVGTRELDALLTDKESVGAELRRALTERATTLGLALHSVGLRDIVLPGEMRAMLNQVILAEKQAQADQIRRRQETASARSQANTAKLLAENPVLTRMKELELLQDILAGTKATFVFGRGDMAEELRATLGTQLQPDDS